MVFQEEPPIEVNLIMSVTVQQKNLPLVNDFAARALREKGETDKAVAEYERLVSPDPNARQKALVHPFNRIRLAALYEAKGDLDRAVEQYADALKVWPYADRALPDVVSARKKLSVLRTKTARSKRAALDAFIPFPLLVSLHGGL